MSTQTPDKMIYTGLQVVPILTGEPSIDFSVFEAGQRNEIMRLDKSGMRYNGKLVEDAGEAHRAFLETMSAMLNHGKLTALTTERDQLRATIAEMPTCRCGLSTDDQCELTAKLGAATTERDSIKQEIELVEHRVYRAEAECMEQARLLGKSGEREADLLGKMERIERKLATITAERDQLRADCENETKWAAHYLAQSIAEKARAARAEAGETVALTNWNGALERAMKAEADLAALEQCHDANCRGVVKIAAELDTEREKAERYRLVTLKQDAELATERARLDWLEKRGPWESWFQPAKEVSLLLRAPIRDAIDKAMKEDAK